MIRQVDTIYDVVFMNTDEDFKKIAPIKVMLEKRGLSVFSLQDYVIIKGNDTVNQILLDILDNRCNILVIFKSRKFDNTALHNFEIFVEEENKLKIVLDGYYTYEDLNQFSSLIDFNNYGTFGVFQLILDKVKNN